MTFLGKLRADFISNHAVTCHHVPNDRIVLVIRSVGHKQSVNVTCSGDRRAYCVIVGALNAHDLSALGSDPRNPMSRNDVWQK